MAAAINSNSEIPPDVGYPTQDLSRCPLLTLLDEVRLLMSQRHALEYRLLMVLRELDQREYVDGHPLHLASWLANNFGLGYGAARERVRTARALGHLPLIDAAFREGKLSYSKVRAITRVAHSENEEQLLSAARFASADGVEHLVRRVKQQERLDDVQAMIRQRSLNYRWDDDGSLVVHARLTPEQGAIWLQALEKAEAELDSDERNSDQRNSDEDYPARQADAVTQALEESLNDRSSRPSQTGDRYQVVVHVPAETFSALSDPGVRSKGVRSKSPAHASNATKPAAIEHGPLLHPETVKRLTCDGALVSIIDNAQGEPLNVGRKTRVIPSAIQRALRARDQGCRYPGCSHTR